MNQSLTRASDYSEAMKLARTLRRANRKFNELNDLVLELYIASRTDKLTGAWNRAEQEDRALRWERRWKPRFVAFADIDNFKLLNDLDGHDAGDCAIIQLSTVIRGHIRRSDFFCRWAGDEFVLVFSNVTHERLVQRLVTLQEKFRSTVDSKVSLSIGVANWLEGECFNSVLVRAESAMRLGKSAGKSRVETDWR